MLSQAAGVVAWIKMAGSSGRTVFESGRLARAWVTYSSTSIFGGNVRITRRPWAFSYVRKSPSRSIISGTCLPKRAEKGPLPHLPVKIWSFSSSRMQNALHSEPYSPFEVNGLGSEYSHRGGAFR